MFFLLFSNFNTLDFKDSKNSKNYMDIHNVVFYKCVNFQIKNHCNVPSVKLQNLTK
jgi:hypothetical protein